MCIVFLILLLGVTNKFCVQKFILLQNTPLAPICFKIVGIDSVSSISKPHNFSCLKTAVQSISKSNESDFILF